MSKNSKYAAAASAALFAVLALSILSPQKYAAACMRGIRLWLNFVLPSLFPFFVLTALITKLGAASKASLRLAPAMQKLFRLPAITAYCLFISALSGYPVGSRVLSDLSKKGYLGRKSALRAAALCSTSGPMFLIGSVGAGMFKSVRFGLILLGSHLAGVLIVSLIAARFAKEAPSSPPPPLYGADNALYESVYGAVLSVLTVGGFIALFFVLTEMLTSFYLLIPLSRLFSALFAPFGGQAAGEGFALGLAEVTHGLAALAGAGGAALPPAAFLITFGGGCILAQQLGYLKKAGVRAGAFIACKAVQAAASFLVCLAVCAAAGLL